MTVMVEGLQERAVPVEMVSLLPHHMKKRRTATHHDLLRDGRLEGIVGVGEVGQGRIGRESVASSGERVGRVLRVVVLATLEGGGAGEGSSGREEDRETVEEHDRVRRGEWRRE